MAVSDDTRLEDAKAIESIIENRLRRQHHRTLQTYEFMIYWQDNHDAGREPISYEERVRQYHKAQGAFDELYALAKDLGLR
jgi:hypothetical protein